MIAYKFVKPKDKKFIEQGSFSVGSSKFYRTMEGELADPLDGAYSRDVNEVHGYYGDDGRFRMDPHPPMDRMLITLKDITVHHTVPENFYAFCAARTATNEYLEGLGYTSVYRIKNLLTFGHSLARSTKWALKDLAVRRVAYRPTNVRDYEQLYRPADTFVKSEKFRPEDEVRVSFKSTSKRKLDEQLFIRSERARRLLEHIRG